MKKHFFFQIKGRNISNNYQFSRWEWPPMFSGRIMAEDKKEAHELINIEYGRKFPLRVLSKDIESNNFLLSIEEMKEGSHLFKLFEKQACIKCGNTFYVIDKYNDPHCTNTSSNYCSGMCQDEHHQARLEIRNNAEVLNGSMEPLIYKITNKETGRIYIGKTKQVFTLRWYQHFFQTGGCKFHEAIRSSKLTDWIFEIQELVIIPPTVKDIAGVERFICEREKYWISHYDSINNGYNTNS